MKRFALGLVALVATLVVGCSGGGGPKVVTPETKVDFGDVVMTPDHKDAKTREFVIKNEGTGDLKLSDIQVKTLQGC